MKLFKESIILTRRHERYGGDSESVLGLVVDYKGYAYLYSDAETISGNGGRLYNITSCPEYINWLLDNSMDLLEMCQDDCPSYWWNDRTKRKGREEEFLYIIEKINKTRN